MEDDRFRRECAPPPPSRRGSAEEQPQVNGVSHNSPSPYPPSSSSSSKPSGLALLVKNDRERPDNERRADRHRRIQSWVNDQREGQLDEQQQQQQQQQLQDQLQMTPGQKEEDEDGNTQED